MAWSAPFTAYNAWDYRNKVTFTEQTANAFTDYRIPLVVNTATLVTGSKMETNGCDIRMVDTAGNALNFWIEVDTMNTATTRIYVKVASLGASGTYEAYMFYGNNTPPATASDFEDTFDGWVANGNFEADTTGQNPANWTVTEGGNDGVVSVSETQTKIESKSVYTQDTSTSGGAFPLITRDVGENISDNVMYEFWIYIDSFTAGTEMYPVEFYQKISPLEQISVMAFDRLGTRKISIYTNAGKVDTGETYDLDTWYKISLSLNFDTDKIKFWLDNSYVNEYNFREIGAESDYLRAVGHAWGSPATGDSYRDGMLLRPWATTEPTSAWDGEEEQSAADVYDAIYFAFNF
jgi:hypothetical protein